MNLSDIYTGLPVRTTKDKILYEVIRIDDVTETIFCNAIGKQNADIKEFRLEELKEL